MNNKSLLALFVISSILIFSLSGCKNLKIDNLKANSHFKKANKYYSEEKYKKAIEEYELALKYNPDLQKAYIYVGTSCSSAYKPSLPAPDEDSEYEKKITEIDDYKQIIADNTTRINEIKENQELNEKLLANESINLQISELEKELSIEIAEYNEYKKKISENERFLKTITANEEMIAKAKEDPKNSELTEADINKKIEENGLLEKNIQENGKFIDKVESYEKFKEISPEIAALNKQILENEEFLNNIETYEEYELKIKENENLTNNITANELYTNKIKKNEEYKQKAIQYLLKAKELEGESEQVILALGEIYDKMQNFVEAEKYYLSMMEKLEESPKTYYTLANFYSKYGRNDRAELMYEKRIELDPREPEGYLYYATFLHNLRKWDKAIDYHEKRIICQIDPEILILGVEVDKLKNDIDVIKRINEFIENLKNNKKVDEAEKNRIIEEKTAQIAQIGDLEELNVQLEEKSNELETKTNSLNDTLENMSKEDKQKISESYYTLGVVCWNKSYQTKADFMAPQERIAVVEKGFEALTKATELLPNNPDPWVYMSLLYREKIRSEPLKRDEYLLKAKELANKFTELRDKKIKREEYMKQLEKM